ncbi:TPA: hypothetical protein ACX6RK_001575 [Photobacterium damselae]
MKKVKTEKELADAIENGEESIEIEGDLGKKTIRIKATGKVAWVVAVGAIAVAIVGLTYPVPEPASQVVVKSSAFMATGGAVGILGMGTATTATLIAIAAGGVGVLDKLRKYKIVDTKNGNVILSRK